MPGRIEFLIDFWILAASTLESYLCHFKPKEKGRDRKKGEKAKLRLTRAHSPLAAQERGSGCTKNTLAAHAHTVIPQADARILQVGCHMCTQKPTTVGLTFNSLPWLGSQPLPDLATHTSTVSYSH